MRLTLLVSSIVAASLACAGCSCDGPATPRDAGIDARPPLDAQIDAPPIDAEPAIDGPLPFDAPFDAPADAPFDAPADAPFDAPIDAGADATVDAPIDASAGLTIIECAPAVAGNEMNSGLSLSPMFWPGMRFQVTTASTLRVIEVNARSDSSSAQTIFGAIVALTGPADVADSPDLVSADVLLTMPIPMPAGTAMSATVRADVSLPLAPGWYMAVFGTGAFGATLPSGTIHSNTGTGGCAGGMFPFSIVRSSGMYPLQAATPHMLVALE